MQKCCVCCLLRVGNVLNKDPLYPNTDTPLREKSHPRPRIDMGSVSRYPDMGVLGGGVLHMYVYLYIHVYVYMYADPYTYTYTYKHIYIYRHIIFLSLHSNPGVYRMLFLKRVLFFEKYRVFLTP